MTGAAMADDWDDDDDANPTGHADGAGVFQDPDYDNLPGIGLTELLRLGHAYLSIDDPQRRIKALRMLEAIAGGDEPTTRQ